MQTCIYQPRKNLPRATFIQEEISLSAGPWSHCISTNHPWKRPPSKPDSPWQTATGHTGPWVPIRTVPREGSLHQSHVRSKDTTVSVISRAPPLNSTDRACESGERKAQGAKFGDYITISRKEVPLPRKWRLSSTSIENKGEQELD